MEFPVPCQHTENSIHSPSPSPWSSPSCPEHLGMRAFLLAMVSPDAHPLMRVWKNLLGKPLALLADAAMNHGLKSESLSRSQTTDGMISDILC